jgi:regulator of PEP synthase PpsR (kinase-PPPase family)
VQGHSLCDVSSDIDQPIEATQEDIDPLRITVGRLSQIREARREPCEQRDITRRIERRTCTDEKNQLTRLMGLNKFHRQIDIMC